MIEINSDHESLQINGSDVSEIFTLLANGNRVRLDRVTPDPFFLDIGGIKNLVVNLNGGDDTFTAGNGLASLIALTVNGGAGNDTITGGDGSDVLNGGDGNDLITGGRGNDTAFMGAGNDTFLWNPGDGSDTVEGQAGFDTLQFNGANISERINISANGSQVRFSRDVANITTDLNGIEQINFNALGGADTITVNDLSGTNVKQVNLNLGSAMGGGDGQADIVTLNGHIEKENINIQGTNGSILVKGLPTAITLENVEVNDFLTIFSNAGNDVISAADLLTPVSLLLSGGNGNDQLIGSRFADSLFGGDGNDTITGGEGNDVALLGTGNDTFLWNPSDGSDTVEGEAGFDTLQFNGANASENIDIFANGSRVRLLRNVGNVTMDLNGIEQINVNALGGTDTIAINDLTGTGVSLVRVNLAGSSGKTADGQADTVIVNGTQLSDAITIATLNGQTVVKGLATQVQITGVETKVDQLVINGLSGNDVIDASQLTANRLHLTLDGGDGEDLLIGSAGNDVVIGRRGNDVALMGAGNDTFLWNPGDGSDVVEGQADFDTLLFNGANISENIDISANGSRVHFFRNVANIMMDLNSIEQINFNAQGGADTITVNDLNTTGVSRINLDLGFLQKGDGQTDTIILNGSAGNNGIRLSNSDNLITVTGLPETVTIANADIDLLIINSGNGNDTIDATKLTSTTIAVTFNGGLGNDILQGSSRNDFLNGGEGNDLLFGGLGADTLTGGAGFDRFRFNNPNEGGDFITDFEANEVIEIKASTFGGGLVAGQPVTDNQFRVGTDAQTASDRFIFNGSTRSLYFDADGTGSLGKILVTTLQTNVNFTAANLRVI
ncbi:MAG: hypothetical protein B0A82_13910 [Alkalinema sp. CACIAM 70d]|nr:MAG: hypothetical protein B0A82_13910 [Alkalinema sp. CACIAM 70d]